jgi:hypothetical protein
MPVIDRTFDRLTGLVTEIGVEDDKLHIRYTQDTAPVHEGNQRLREADEYKRAGIKKGFWHCVRLTDADCLKMMVEDGFNPYVAHAKDLRRHLSRHRDKYRHLLVTDGQF